MASKMPCWSQNIKKKRLEKRSKKNNSKKGVGGNEGTILVVLKYTENNPQNRDTRPKNTPSQLALWRIINVAVL